MPARCGPILVACVIAVAAAQASADPLQLTIQPIQVCDDLGVVCANPTRTLFGNYTRAIWLQAGIWFTALGWQVISSSALLDATMFELAANRPEVPGVLNVWFVDEILDCGSVEGPYGCGFIGGNGVAIASRAVLDRRVDVLAHELGHNLGLDHLFDPFNLMALGGQRLVPFRIEDVYPLGPFSRLDVDQIAVAQASPHLVPVPEPASLALVLTGVGALAFRLRRRHGTGRGEGRHLRLRRAAPVVRTVALRPRACGRPPCGRGPAR